VALGWERGPGAKSSVGHDPARVEGALLAAEEHVIAARQDLGNLSDPLKRATQDYLTGRRRSPGVMPHDVGTGQAPASNGHEDHNKH
jgi:hypothetical protein